MSNRLYSEKDKTSHLIQYKFGFWYLVPNSLTLEGWDEWGELLKSKHPIQYFIRSAASDFAYSIKRIYRDSKYAIKCFFKPYHSDIRKAIPRKWADVSSLVIDVNFAMILSFKKEADESCVDWDGTDGHRKFKNWLDAAAKWIQEDRPAIEKQRDNAYPPYPLPEHMRDWNYDQLYGEVNKLEKIINETDSTIIKQMVDYRDYMWT
jgi:hypothetical protein